METNIVVKKKQNYGNDMVYPVNTLGFSLCKLLGTKTFTPSHIRDLKGLGFTFEIKQEDLTL